MNLENQCFCELAPLYALNLLSEPEQHWVEQQLAASPELTEELAEYETAVTAIPYSTPVMPMTGDLKARLFNRLELDLPESQPNPNPISYQAVRSPELEWRSHTVPGVEIAMLHTDLVKREIVGVFRAEPGMQYPMHRHAAFEEIYMLQGDLVVDDAVYCAGDYIRSQPGSSHQPYTVGGCMFFFRTSMDDEYPDLVTAEAE